MQLLARLILLVAAIVAAIIGLGILLTVLEANTGNSIVSAVLDAADALVGPFDDMFTPKNRKLAVAINWGIALVIYLVVGRLLSSLVTRAGVRAGRGLRRRRERDH